MTSLFLMESSVCRVVPQTFVSSFEIVLKPEQVFETPCDLVEFTRVLLSSILRDLVVSCYDQLPR
jgi:hypothetical protein